MDKKKLITFLLALTMILSLTAGVSAAETTEAKVPVTLTVVNTVAPISCTDPAALPVSLVDGYVVCANNAAITNTAKTGSIKVTKVDVRAGTFEIGNYDDFSASKNSIALSINGCATKGAGTPTPTTASSMAAGAITAMHSIGAREAARPVPPATMSTLTILLLTASGRQQTKHSTSARRPAPSVKRPVKNTPTTPMRTVTASATIVAQPFP